MKALFFNSGGTKKIVNNINSFKIKIKDSELIFEESFGALRVRASNLVILPADSIRFLVCTETEIVNHFKVDIDYSMSLTSIKTIDDRSLRTCDFNIESLEFLIYDNLFVISIYQNKIEISAENIDKITLESVSSNVADFNGFIFD